MTITAREIRSEVSESLTDLETGMTDKLNTAIEQTAEQISLVASRFNEDGSIKNTAGLVTTAEANKMFAFDSAGNLVSFIEQTASSIKIKAKNIALEGLVTANGNFKILTDGSIEAVNANLRGSVYAVTGKIGGFTIESGRLYWKAKDYFGNDSRSLKLGVSQTDTDGVVDVAFNAATAGRFGVKSVGSNLGGSAIYASTGELAYPGYGQSFAGFFVGPVDVRDTNYGIASDACASKKFRYIVSRNSDGTYTYNEGVDWGNGASQNPDLDKIRLIVRGGIIVGYTGE